jgi:HD superfamily phosphohydrolase
VKRIFDPIHRFIELDAGEVALLNGPGAAAAPPAATRPRLSGVSLGRTLALHARARRARDRATRALDACARTRPKRSSPNAISPNSASCLRASLLLHDVGHGPFSHACESVLGVRHEQRTEDILALRPRSRGRSPRSASTPSEVLALIDGHPTRRIPCLRELVSGPNLDADRMDYLLRDAYFTGVVNGRYDVEQLIASLRAFWTATDAGNSASTAAASSRSRASCSRATWMFATIYFHHTTRAFERVPTGLRCA